MGAVRDHSITIACIGAGAAIITAVAKPVCEALLPSKSESPRTVAAASADPGATPTPVTPTPGGIEGAWKQYILTQDEGAVYLGSFVVARAQGEYVISPRNQIEGERMENSIGVTDVSYDGRDWTFNSNWGKGRVGNFELERLSPTVFEGEIRVAGKFENRTRFVKIE
jgi:hypothetical protein